MRLEKEEITSISFETKQVVIEHFRSIKNFSVFKNSKLLNDFNWKVLSTTIQFTTAFYIFPIMIKELIFRI